MTVLRMPVQIESQLEGILFINVTCPNVLVCNLTPQIKNRDLRCPPLFEVFYMCSESQGTL